MQIRTTPLAAASLRAPTGLKVMIGLLAGLIAGCAMIVLAACWTAITRVPNRQVTVEDCRAIVADDARLACFDRASIAPEPAKGARAPHF